MKHLWAVCAVVLMILCGAQAMADIEVKDLPTALDSFTLGVDIHTFYRVDSSPYFGASIPQADGSDTFKDAHWGEIFSKFRATAMKDMGWAKTSGQVSLWYAQTIDQDAYGLRKDESDTGWDQAWIQFGGLFGSPVDLTVGRQSIQIEKWFLVGDGGKQDAATWLPMVDSFPMAVRADVALAPVSITAFWARPEFRPGDPFQIFGTMRDGGDVDLTGINVHYDATESVYLYGGYYHTFDQSDDMDNHLNVYDIGGQATLFGNLVLEGEYALQRGTFADDFDVSASAWWTSIGLNFPVAHNPYIRGTYVSYSGDDDPTDDDVKGWNPFFTNFIGWNRWVQGEQTGELWLAPTNKKVAIAEVGFAPLENVFVSLHYLRHQLDEKFGPFTGAPLDSDKWGQEVNLFVDSPVNEHVFISFGTGATFPDDAAKEEAANIDAAPGGDTDKTAFFAQLWMSLSI